MPRNAIIGGLGGSSASNSSADPELAWRESKMAQEPTAGRLTVAENLAHSKLSIAVTIKDLDVSVGGKIQKQAIIGANATFPAGALSAVMGPSGSERSHSHASFFPTTPAPLTNTFPLGRRQDKPLKLPDRRRARHLGVSHDERPGAAQGC